MMASGSGSRTAGVFRFLAVSRSPQLPTGSRGNGRAIAKALKLRGYWNVLGDYFLESESTARQHAMIVRRAVTIGRATWRTLLANLGLTMVASCARRPRSPLRASRPGARETRPRNPVGL